MLFFISQHSKKKQLAEQFIEFLAQANIQKHLSQKFNLAPARLDTELSHDKYSLAGFEILKKAKAVSPFFDRATLPAFEKIAVKAFAQFLQDGDVAKLTEALETARRHVFIK